MICIDLEDGVAAGAKEAGRRALLAFMQSSAFDASRVSVRINDPATDLGRRDLAAIAESGRPLELLVLPKAVDTATVNLVFELCSVIRSVMVLIETARGLSNVFALTAHERVLAVGFGSADWSAEIGCAMQWDALLYARSRIVHAAIEGHCIPISGGWLQLHDERGLEVESRRLRDLGFQGQIALHPKQLATILRSFSPDREEIEQAKKVLQAADHTDEGAFQMDGLMVDEPMIKRARRVLDAAGQTWVDRGNN